MKKTIIGVVVVVIIILIALYMRSTGPVATNDMPFEDEAAAILSSPASNQAKIDNLNSRIQARKARAAKIGAVAKPLPLSPTAQKTVSGTK